MDHLSKDFASPESTSLHLRGDDEQTQPHMDTKYKPLVTWAPQKGPSLGCLFSCGTWNLRYPKAYEISRPWAKSPLEALLMLRLQSHHPRRWTDGSRMAPGWRKKTTQPPRSSLFSPQSLVVTEMAAINPSGKVIPPGTPQRPHYGSDDLPEVGWKKQGEVWGKLWEIATVKDMNKR